MGDRVSKRNLQRRFRPGVFLLLLQLVAIFVVVAVPWLLNKDLMEQTLTAQDWVVHAAENKSAVSAVKTAIGNVERSRLMLLLDVERETVESEIAGAYSDAKVRLDQLAVSTANNPEQQARVVQLQALVDVHLANTGRVLDLISAGERTLAREVLENPSDRERLSALKLELIQEEDRNLDRRRAEALRQRKQIDWAANGIAVAQLILLALIVALSERQQRRRARAEQISRIVRERADRILRTARDPILVLDRNLRVEQCNPAFEQLYGGESERFIGTALANVGGGAWNDPSLLQRLRDVLFLDRELWDYEVEQETSAGGKRRFVVNAWSMPGERGRDEPVVILTASDVTARHHAEQRIRELNEQLSTRVEEISQVNRDLEAFSYSVSHDLRAPLRHISAFAGKLEGELTLEPGSKAQSHLEVIGHSARRMGKLIDELLLHSRLGRGQIKRVPVDMSVLVQEVRSELAPEMGGRSIEWQVGELPAVSGDPSMLRLVWQNLIGNALKYSSGRDPARIEIVAHEDTDHGEWVFCIEDNGAGFDMAYVEKLFGVFQRLHTEAEFPGTGIGLANVRRIVVRHGGRVWAEGEPDRGARFHFSLPMRAAAIENEDAT